MSTHPIIHSSIHPSSFKRMHPRARIHKANYTQGVSQVVHAPESAHVWGMEEALAATPSVWRSSSGHNLDSVARQSHFLPWKA